MDAVWLHEFGTDDGITITLSNLGHGLVHTWLAEFSIARRHNPYDLHRLDTVPHLGQFFEGVHTLVVIGTETDNYGLGFQWCLAPPLVPLPGVEATLAIRYALGRCEHLGTYGDGVTDNQTFKHFVTFLVH